MSYTILDWMVRHPQSIWVSLLVGIVLFCLWLAAPVGWQSTQRSVVDEGENVAGWLRMFRRF